MVVCKGFSLTDCELVKVLEDWVMVWRINGKEAKLLVNDVSGWGSGYHSENEGGWFFISARFRPKE